MLKIENLSYKIKDKNIIQDISLNIANGEFVGIIGPNGSGKSTLLKNIYKVLTPSSGKIYLNNKNLLNISNREMANEIAVVLQENDAGFDFTVEEVVLMGRFPVKGLLEQNNSKDMEIVKDSLNHVGMIDFIERSYQSLSGGEKQRTIIARALAQQTEMIILDEPTNHLDIGSQIKTLNLLKESKKTILTALHDLNIASKYCDRIYVMSNGKIICNGKPNEVITKALIKDLHDIESEVFEREKKTYINYF